jgi:hypothetical protein
MNIPGDVPGDIGLSVIQITGKSAVSPNGPQVDIEHYNAVRTGT